MPTSPSARRAPRAAALALALLGGFAVGVLGSFLQAVELAGLPMGTVIVLAATGFAFFSAGSVGHSRGVAVVCAIGWGLAVLSLITPRAAGDVVLTAELRTYVFLGGGLLLAALASSWPYGVTRRGDPVAPPDGAADGDDG